ncbi:MAG: hypothetical protein D6E12_05870 [Desulfovibrio sp.]|nr:MAG: hypothetical protein D6E12_05870 [Desulfovibrio sp.]
MIRLSLISGLLLASAVLLLTACSHVDVEHNLSGSTRLRVHSFVNRPYSPQLYVRPSSFPQRELTAVFLPFRIRQSMDNAAHYGREVGRIFWQSWLDQEVFPVLEFTEDTPWRGGDAAVAVARAKGADLAIGGDITYFMAGGTVGRSQVTLRMEIYDAHSGSLIWSIEHSGMMANDLTRDYILFTHQTRLPADPIYAITVALAEDIAEPVIQWQVIPEDQQQEPSLLSEHPPAEATDQSLY